MIKQKEEDLFLSSTSSPSKIRKKTAIINILIIIALPFFAYYLGYKYSNWLLQFVCLAAFPFVVYNAFKYFFKTDYRKTLNEYHDNQKALPKEERDGPVYGMGIIIFSMILFLVTILAGIILNFFNLL